MQLGPGLVSRAPKTSRVRGKVNKVGCFYTRRLGQAPPVRLPWSRKEKEARDWPGREGIQTREEQAWAHSDTVLPSSLTTSAGYPPDSTHTAKASTWQGAGARPRPPASSVPVVSGQASLLEVLTSGLTPSTSAPSTPGL